MLNKSNYRYLLSDLSILKGVGKKTANLLKKKGINNIFDLLWRLPKSFTDLSLSSKIKDLKIDENQTVTIIPNKYNFPRKRNLPNRVLCSDETGEIECVFFNSYEGYIRKILPLGKEITISGKIKFFRKLKTFGLVVFNYTIEGFLGFFLLRQNFFQSHLTCSFLHKRTRSFLTVSL